ncbi:MAG: hypothetical protein IKK17_02995 [Oscillospiraceae bacterium]|nr:hypothetical protein [Oscillospiraceae bacterium]
MRGREPWVRYTVYDNKTDLPIIVDGTAKECARAMNRSEASFRSAVTRCEQGKNRRWTIYKSAADELEELF